jgi:hypothetical protein
MKKESVGDLQFPQFKFMKKNWLGYEISWGNIFFFSNFLPDLNSIKNSAFFDSLLNIFLKYF